jgi:hypothetical protein
LGIAPPALNPQGIHGRAGNAVGGETSRPAASPLRMPTPTMVAFFASHPDEPAAEEVFTDPLDGQTRRRFGVFTYYLHQAVKSGEHVSFAGLAQIVGQAYRSRPFPTPQFSGALGQRFPDERTREALTAGR